MFKKMSIFLEQFLLQYGYAPSKSKRETNEKKRQFRSKTNSENYSSFYNIFIIYYIILIIANILIDIFY